MKFPITFKLILITIIPISVLAYYMYVDIKTEFNKYNRIIDLNRFTHFSRSADSLLKNLHFEKNNALAFLENDNHPQARRQLESQFRQSDLVLENFKNTFLSNLIIADQDSHLSQQLQLLPTMRKGALYRTTSAEQLTLYYDTLIEEFLGSVEHYRFHSTDQKVTLYAGLLKELLILKERATQEKILLQDVFTTGQMSAQQYQLFSRLLITQRHHTDVIIDPINKLDFARKLPDLKKLEMGVNDFRETILSHNEKQKLFIQLETIIGYGGLVHDFKNYLLRDEQHYYDRFMELYPLLITAINSYQLLAINNQAEYTELLILEDVFGTYRKNLDLIPKMRAEGNSIEAIDKVVRIDDTVALKALARLPGYALDQNPQRWFQAATQRLGSIEEMQVNLTAITQERIEQLQNLTREQLIQRIAFNLFVIVLLLALTYTLAQHIIKSVKTVQDGLIHFFDYISFKRNKPITISLNSGDELALMANEINRQIEQTQDRLQQDEVFIYEATEVTAKMRDGDFDVSTHFRPVSPSLQKLCDVLNELIRLIQQKIAEQTQELADINASLSEKVQEQTRELEQKFQELNQFKQAIERSMLFCTISEEGTVTEANSAFCTTLKYHELEVIGQNMTAFIDAHSLSRLSEELYPVITQGEIYQGHQQLVSKNGIIVHTDSTIMPIFDAEGDILEYICLFHNITPIIEARDKAIAAERSKDEFLSNMSHEIRTPLNAILGFVGILQKRIEDEKTRHYLDIIDNSGKSLLAIINDILDFAKIQSGKFQISPHHFEPIEEFSNTAMLFASKAYEKSITYLVYIDPNLPDCLNADLVRIKQVISNLLSNAIKFTPETGTVKMRITYENGMLHVTVQDSGIGISPKNQARIFNAFEQADGSTTREFGGTGLGLSISAKLVELMHGTLTLNSQPNEGSIFAFSIPCTLCDTHKRIEHHYEKIRSLKIGILAHSDENTAVMRLIHRYLADFGITNVQDNWDADNNGVDLVIFIPDDSNLQSIIDSGHPAIALQKEPDSRLYEHSHIFLLNAPFVPTAVMEALDDATIERLRGYHQHQTEEVPQFAGHILVVEDNKTNQMLITLLLDDYGLEYSVANDGLEAVEAVKTQHFDLILMDENMPNLNGIEAMKRIKSHEKAEGKAATPIIALTANVMQGDRERFLAEGMDGFVGKPVDNNELEVVLKQFLPMRA